MQNAVIKFWFEDISQTQWWKKDAQFDQLIASRFSEVHGQASCGELYQWRDTAEGRLAEIIVLDQFSRNMFRGLAESFAYDSLALELCKAAVNAGAHTRLEQSRTSFLLMPYMHSELLQEHQQGWPLFERYCSENTSQFERRHAAIIERFGRYPHRNTILGRESTPEEIEFLTEAGSSF